MPTDSEVRTLDVGGLRMAGRLPSLSNYEEDLFAAMNAGRWQAATMLLIAKVDALYKAQSEKGKAVPARVQSSVGTPAIGSADQSSSSSLRVTRQRIDEDEEKTEAR